MPAPLIREASQDLEPRVLQPAISSTPSRLADLSFDVAGMLLDGFEQAVTLSFERPRPTATAEHDPRYSSAVAGVGDSPTTRASRNLFHASTMPSKPDRNAAVHFGSREFDPRCLPFAWKPCSYEPLSSLRSLGDCDER